VSSSFRGVNEVPVSGSAVSPRMGARGFVLLVHDKGRCYGYDGSSKHLLF